MTNSPHPIDSLPSDPQAAKLKDTLEQVASGWLAPYTKRMRCGLERPSAKIINDLLWGSIRLFPWEVALLDSPLMQRLRGIRQLGVIHWVYPSAGHSRFEHSLGVVHTTQVLLDGLERSLLREEERDVVGWLALTDEGLLQSSPKTAQDLRERRLLKRAFFLSSSFEPSESQDSGSAWRKFRGLLKRGKLDKKLLSEAKEVVGLLGGDASALAEMPPAIDEVPKSKLGLDQFAFIGDAFGDLELANPALSSQRAEVAKLIACSGIHVFAPEKLQLAVFFATAKLFEECGLPSNPEAYTRTKIEPKELKKAYELLRDKGYLSSNIQVTDEKGVRSHQKRGVEDLLRAAWPRVEQLATNFGRYQSPHTEPISTSSIASFLRQFEAEERVRAALRMLERVEFKDRSYFAKAIESNIRKALDKGEIDYICPLGKSGDSSTLLSYFISDLPPEYQRPVMSLELALEREPNHGILLWDDFCGAGGHAMTAISQWMGNCDDVADLLHEDLADELSDERKAQLLNTKLYVTFAMSREQGLTKLARALETLGLSQAEVLPSFEVIPEVDALFSGEGDIFYSEDEQRDLREFLQNKAMRILEPRLHRDKNPWTEQKRSERLLGYGNTSQLLVFYYNVPTVTLTPLWLGEESERGWKPLFARRGKPST